MGCDTKGYVIGADFLAMLNIMRVTLDTHESELHQAKISMYPSSIRDEYQFSSMSFTYDAEASRRGIRMEYSPRAENRSIHIGASSDSEDPRVEDGPVIQYGYLSLGAWGHSVEIMKMFLLTAKERGFEVYIVENDCLDDSSPIQL